MQSNSEEQREKATENSLNVSPEQTRPVGDLWKKQKTARRWTSDWNAVVCSRTVHMEL